MTGSSASIYRSDARHCPELEFPLRRWSAAPAGPGRVAGWRGEEEDRTKERGREQWQGCSRPARARQPVCTARDAQSPPGGGGRNPSATHRKRLHWAVLLGTGQDRTVRDSENNGGPPRSRSHELDTAATGGLSARSRPPKNIQSPAGAAQCAAHQNQNHLVFCDPSRRRPRSDSRLLLTLAQKGSAEETRIRSSVASKLSLQTQRTCTRASV
ncbi:hypothetical protein AAFF_G00013070 [Aldrovandia affinis]|uniref:Uncharacterized protein n=1 Tax=Aldrovandia affinis TaxID=143900 RepID=A0AAD7S6T5_9TELE|nr:hypothetical protein AAFF_G00013070 [Aldrovandia affinis]